MAKNKLEKRQKEDLKELKEISWSHGDYVKLGKAISNFNKKVKRIETKENMAYLPDLMDYSYLKKTISTREEYNRLVNNLKDFQKDGQEKLMKLPSGMYITKWEKQFAKENINRAKARLRQERDEIRRENKGKRPYETQREKEIKAQLKNLQGFNTKWGYELKLVKRRAFKTGRTDFEMYKARIFKDNYYKAMQDLEKFENYKIFKKKLDSIKNPIEFYEYISQNEVLTDLFLWYKDGAGAYAYGGFANNEEAFNSGLQDLGLID